jgi:hypothetical protein
VGYKLLTYERWRSLVAAAGHVLAVTVVVGLVAIPANQAPRASSNCTTGQTGLPSGWRQSGCYLAQTAAAGVAERAGSSKPGRRPGLGNDQDGAGRRSSQETPDPPIVPGGRHSQGEWGRQLSAELAGYRSNWPGVVVRLIPVDPGRTHPWRVSSEPGKLLPTGRDWLLAQWPWPWLALARQLTASCASLSRRQPAQHTRAPAEVSVPRSPFAAKTRSRAEPGFQPNGPVAGSAGDSRRSLMADIAHEP